MSLCTRNEYGTAQSFIHRKWDRRAQRDIGKDDIVIFATGDANQPPSRWNGDDIDERCLKEGGKLE